MADREVHRDREAEFAAEGPISALIELTRYVLGFVDHGAWLQHTMKSDIMIP